MKVYEIFTEIHIFEKLMILLKLFLKYNDKKRKKKKMEENVYHTYLAR